MCSSLGRCRDDNGGSGSSSSSSSSRGDGIISQSDNGDRCCFNALRSLPFRCPYRFIHPFLGFSNLLRSIALRFGLFSTIRWERRLPFCFLYVL
uniref:Uncharacterized protein n=1 Tax=Picea sitchensis TaxID=3332 RepID=A9NQW3_PICSI|nr:unknown [Picea sitchensis]